MTAKGRVFANPTWKVASPVVSVLIPFLRDDPSALLILLNEEAGAVDGSVEIVVLDDGTRDPELTRRLTALIKGMTLPARLITLPRNEGRSIGRNRLATAARGGSLLFLDSDMRPDYRRFLRDWADLVAREDPPVAFGGISLLQAPVEPRFAVHRAMATKSECVAYTVRARQPEKYVYTSNLLVRRDVFAAEAFDPGFTGWGWEDVEWAMRVSQRFRVLHVDNPATHMGLDTVADLAGRGHEIGCHSHGHIDAHRAGEVALLADSERNVTRLTALGGSARHFAFPYGEVSPVAKARLADRYGSLRGVHAGLVRDGGDLNQLPAVGIEGDSGEAVARQWIDRAVETHAWLILFTHDVSDTPSPWGCTPAALDRLAAHARAAGCALKTVGEVLDR